MLQSIVMAYGGISPETPLTLSLSVSRPTTRLSSSSESTESELHSALNSGVFNGGMAGGVAAVVTPSSSAPVVPVLARPWSRPSSSGSYRPILKKV